MEQLSELCGKDKQRRKCILQRLRHGQYRFIPLQTGEISILLLGSISWFYVQGYVSSWINLHCGFFVILFRDAESRWSHCDRESGSHASGCLTFSPAFLTSSPTHPSRFTQIRSLPRSLCWLLQLKGISFYSELFWHSLLFMTPFIVCLPYTQHKLYQEQRKKMKDHGILNGEIKQEQLK